MPANIQKNIQSWITNWLSKQGLSTQFQISLLIGDGSSRSFYRITTSTQGYILISDPDWVQTQDYPAHQNYLKKLDLPVPEFYSSDPKHGFLLMQDLGDELLQLHIYKNSKDSLRWLERGVELLADLHGKTFPVPNDLPVNQRQFDAEKYFSEFQFTFEYLNQKLLNQPKMTAFQEGELRQFCQSIAEISPSVFCHRDYHCRNLLVSNNQLVMIDFQDARMGSPHYDLASFIYDPYQPLSDQDRKNLVASYKTRISRYAVSQNINWDSFDNNLKQVAFQRTVKAAGSFASFFIRFGKTTHWAYLLPALSSAQTLQKEKFGVSSSVIDLEKWMALFSQIKIQ